MKIKFIAGIILALVFAFIAACNLDNIPAFAAAFAAASVCLYIAYKNKTALEKQTHYLTYEEAKKLGIFNHR